MISSLRIAAQNKDLKEDIRRLGLTFAIALITGWTFLQLGIPAPFLIGSLLGVWIFGRLFKTFRNHLGVARWFHVPVILGLGQRHDWNDHSGINHRIPVFASNT